MKETFVACVGIDLKERELEALIQGCLDELCADKSIDVELTGRYKRILDDFIEREAVPHYNIVELGEIETTTCCAYYHEKFEQVLAQVQLDEPVMLIGPAGSGKNVAVTQIAQGLGLPMHCTNNACSSKRCPT